MKFAVVLYLCLGVVLSRRHRGNSCNSLIANLERDRDRVVERCTFDVNCGPPKDLENAVVNYTCTYFDSVATYSCKEGFSFIGYTQDVVCGVFENWSDILGTCVVDCDYPPDVEGATVCYQATTLGAVATYYCEDSDAVIVGPDEATCDATGMWTPVVTSCVMPVTCPDAPGSVACADFEVVSTSPFEAVANYPCFPGYKREGPDQAVCNVTGTWSPVVAPCVCPGRTEQFVKYPRRILFGFNDQVIFGINTAEECKSRCLQATGFLCKSVEFYISNQLCVLSASGRCDVGDKFVETDGTLVLYERTCGE